MKRRLLLQIPTGNGNECGDCPYLRVTSDKHVCYNYAWSKTGVLLDGGRHNLCLLAERKSRVINNSHMHAINKLAIFATRYVLGKPAYIGELYEAIHRLFVFLSDDSLRGMVHQIRLSKPRLQKAPSAASETWRELVELMDLNR